MPVSKTYRKFSNKRVNAEKEGIDFNLTFNEYKSLLKEAGITWFDVGNRGYHLARYDDTGSYEIGNCRFINYLDNIKEKKISDESREASRQNMIKANSLKTKEERQRISSLAGKRTIELGYGFKELDSDIINKRIHLINESGIDLMKYGWVKKVSDLLGVTHTQVRRFMKKHYTGEYFVRR